MRKLSEAFAAFEVWHHDLLSEWVPDRIFLYSFQEAIETYNRMVFFQSNLKLFIRQYL